MQKSNTLELDQSVVHPRFATIELTPSKGSTPFSPDITKVGADLNDHIISFQAILIQKHEIDKIKSDDRIKAAEFSIKNANEKITRGLKLIEYMLQERYWFLKDMRAQDDKVIEVIHDLHAATEIEDLKQYDKKIVEEKLNVLKETLFECQQNFIRANSSLLALDKRFLYQADWKRAIAGDQSDKEVHELLKFNLMESSSSLYSLFKKRLSELISIQDANAEEHQAKRGRDKDRDKDREVVIVTADKLSDSQIQKLIHYLESFSDQLAEKVPIQIKILCHLWIEDLIKVQAMYQRNLAMYSAFLSQFQGKFEDIIHFIQKTEQNVSQLRSDNQNAFRLLKMIELPQVQVNQNIAFHNNAQQKLQQSQKTLAKLQTEVGELFVSKSKVKFLQASEEVKLEDDELKPIGEFPLAHKLEFEEREMLRTLKFKEVQKLSKQFEYLKIETDSMLRTLAKVKEMWVCEKKLRKAQEHYINSSIELKRAIQALRAVPDINALGDQALLELSGIGAKLLDSLRMLQKYINSLNFYLTSAKSLQQVLPNIGDFIVLIERFLLKANLLQEQAISAAINEYRKVDSLVEYKRKMGAFKKPPRPATPPAEPTIDSDQEFENRFYEQGYKARKNNVQVEDESLLQLPQRTRPASLGKGLAEKMVEPQLVSLTEDLLNSNKGNIKVENIYNQITL